ncbi:MAG: cbb3-type cytochrome c oxidase subunit I [Rhodobacterales bacterium]|nr:cbb3-type cytochrome c oxidase subunit I [Rhodobacterales bacterium]
MPAADGRPFKAWPHGQSLAGGLYEDLSDSTCAPCIQREMAGWAWVAILSLAGAGLFAVLLVLSRTPGVHEVFPWPKDFFEKGLIIHVIFSFVVWFLAVFGFIAYVATLQVGNGAPRLVIMGRIGWLATAVSVVLLAVPAMLDRGAPSLNNYVPVIIDPLYYAGLAVLAAGLALVVLRLVLNMPGRTATLNPLGTGALAGGVIYLIALFCFGLSLSELAGDPPTHAYNEDLFWAGGHVLQFVNVAMLVVGWYLLAGIAFNEPPMSTNAYNAALLWLVVSAATAPVLFWLYDPFTAEQILAFTNLQYALAPPTVLVAGALTVSILRRRRVAGSLPWRDPGFLCLVLSFAEFALGGVLGLFVDGADARTPAHYHGVISGVNLVFMGLFFVFFLPLQDRLVGAGRAIRVQIWLFFGGQLLFSLGLFLAGGHGAMRKVAGNAQGLEGVLAYGGMVVYGIGSLLAIIGGVMFIVTVIRALLREPQAGV